MTQQHTPIDRDTRPTPSRPLVDWLDRHFDAPQREHSGPEALAWDGHGLQAMNHPLQAMSQSHIF